MRFIINTVASSKDEEAMLRIRKEVFEREKGITTFGPGWLDDAKAFHVVARVAGSADPVATLSVVDTTGDERAHEGYGLRFGAGARAARYTQLAVLKPYRGKNLPVILMLYAHYQFVAPNRFQHTWLLLDAERAASSYVCDLFGFKPGEETFPSEFGRSRVLVRDELTPHSGQAVRYAKRYFEEIFCSPAPQHFPAHAPVFKGVASASAPVQ